VDDVLEIRSFGVSDCFRTTVYDPLKVASRPGAVSRGLRDHRRLFGPIVRRVPSYGKTSLPGRFALSTGAVIASGGPGRPRRSKPELLALG
jgi:hypothetical protein